MISCVDLGGIEAWAVGAALVCRRACRLSADGAKGFELSDPSSAKGFEALEPGVAVRGSLEEICRETPAGITHSTGDRRLLSPPMNPETGSGSGSGRTGIAGLGRGTRFVHALTTEATADEWVRWARRARPGILV